MRASNVLLALLSFCLVVPALPAWADGHPGKTDVFRTEADFAHAVGVNARYDGRLRGWRLQDEPMGGYVKSGTVTLGELHYGAFDQAVVSWNADCPLGTWLRVEASVSGDDGETWSDWLEVARWGDREATRYTSVPVGPKRHAIARINEDTIETREAADRLRVRVVLHTERPGTTPLLTLVAVAAVHGARTLPPDDTRHPAWGKEVKGTFRSQGRGQADMSYRVCGPTSTAMALAAHGITVSTEEVARRCWDDFNGIYGNWPFIAAAASDVLRSHAGKLSPRAGTRKAAEAWVAWPPDWKGVEDEVLAGRPCVVSIKFKEGALPGSPTSASAGHLILVTGFTATGDPIALDPAARKAEAGRIVYGRRPLHAARRGGPVIVVHPYD